MSTGPQLIHSAQPRERNWLPLAVSVGVVVIGAAAAFLVMQRGNTKPTVAAINAQADAYSASLPITNIVMSESASLAGSKVTYIDGHIANKGNRTVTGITVQTLFRNVAKEVAQNETQSLMFIRTRDPYVDIQPVSAAPLKPGDERDFRLSFDSVSSDWDGAYPQLRILQVEAR